MGFDRREVAYIDMAAKLGVGNPDTTAANIVELNEAAGASRAGQRPQGQEPRGLCDAVLRLPPPATPA